METCDVVIIGGGISGLYTAWRLATCADLSVRVLECTNRFGGRYLSCEMPGGFIADMGAMRFNPDTHIILNKLIAEDFRLETRAFDVGSVNNNNTAKHFYRNQHIDYTELHSLCNLDESDVQFCTHSDVTKQVEMPKNSTNFWESTVRGTGIKTKDMTVNTYASLSKSSEPMNIGHPYLNMNDSLAVAVGFRMLSKSTGTSLRMGYKSVTGGIEMLIESLVNKLRSITNVQLLNQFLVTEVHQQSDGFLVKSLHQISMVKCKKLILACNKGGMEIINWVSDISPSLCLQPYLDEVQTQTSFKLYMTYERPWWEEHGLYSGFVLTDLVIGRIIALGDAGKSNGYYTILACYCRRYNSVFEGLNSSEAERFENSCGNIPKELTPSKRLVDYVQKQMTQVLGRQLADIPSPVAAACKVWSSPLSGGVASHPKVGVDGNELAWKMLKPFNDVDMYITGDTFPPSSVHGFYAGWSEAALLNSERLLTKYFNLTPYCPNLPLTNDWL